MRDTEVQSAAELGLQGCQICTCVGSATGTSCGTCGATLHAGWTDSIQRTWAWLITSMVLYVPANFLPILHTQTLGKVSEKTVLGGVVALWEHESYPIAIVIFVASVLVPLAKILVLAWLCLSVQLGSTFIVSQKTKLYRVTEFVGRWSMVDVFVVGILVALIQLGNVMSILPGAAALAFAVMVVASMLAAMAFDPRLLWANVFEERSE